MKRLALLVLPALLACPPKPLPPPDPPTRCEVKLDELQLFAKLGTGANAKVIEGAAELIGGGFAQARAGDVALSNDKIRVVIQQPTRTISPTPYGGAIIDADLVRAAGEAGRDAFGKLAPLYAFGRTPAVTKVEILEDGSKGGYAVVAATGKDAVLDYINVTNVLNEYLGAVELRSDPNTAVPLLVTTYYVLSPGETRVRLLSAFCNEGSTPITTMVGDLIDSGGETEFFNPQGCANGLGAADCLVDPSTWFGYQASGVAYGYRSYSTRDRKTVATNAVLSIAGVVGVLSEGKDRDGLLSWTSTSREPVGAVGILPVQPRLFLRDFFVEQDLARVQAGMLALDAAPRSRLDVTVLDGAGQPVPQGRIAVYGAETQKPVTLAIADAAGKARFDVPVGNYRVSTGAYGVALENPIDVAAPTTGEAQVTVRQGARRTLTVSVRDPFMRPLTAKVVVKCPSGVCPNEIAKLRAFFAIEPTPSDVQAIAFVPASGTTQLPLPPGAYEIFVTRGPEYSAWPDTFPGRGQAVDLSTTDARLDVTLAQVVDTTGWISADLHVHAVGSPDSSVPNAVRVASFAAEGVDVMVSTDHDFITDFAPVVRELGLEGSMASLIGCEVTPFDYGHQNAFPLTVREGPGGAPFDWAGGDGPSLRLDQLFSGLRGAWPDAVIQMNHPRGGQGASLSQLKVDTARGTSAANPATFRMEANPAATASDTKLFSLDFDAIELMNGTSASLAVANDWMTFLSRGWVKTATGVSDTHDRDATTGGYGRTWLYLGADATPARFTPALFTAAMKQHRAVGSSGPFITLTAKRQDGQGATAAIGDTLSLPANTPVELTVEVQAPEWMQFDAIEVHTHAPGREAVNGVSNSDWPPSRTLARRELPIGTLTVEPVPGLNGFSARRVHVTERFTVTPAADTWYVAMVRSSSAARPLAPMAWTGVRCTNGVCRPTDNRAEAFTNAILVDADGSGAYDRFPLQPGSPLLLPPPARSTSRVVPTGEQLDEMLRALLRHEH
ncbi:MAG: CehA/McbA family metallohydrolase [Myxococcaceae bacterium]|nr:CehA/McbA family metallohydrolase [Myxococcaceae bacterium]